MLRRRQDAPKALLAAKANFERSEKLSEAKPSGRSHKLVLLG